MLLIQFNFIGKYYWQMLSIIYLEMNSNICSFLNALNLQGYLYAHYIFYYFYGFSSDNLFLPFIIIIVSYCFLLIIRYFIMIFLNHKTNFFMNFIVFYYAAFSLNSFFVSFHSFISFLKICFFSVHFSNFIIKIWHCFFLICCLNEIFILNLDFFESFQLIVDFNLKLAVFYF